MNHLVLYCFVQLIYTTKGVVVKAKRTEGSFNIPKDLLNEMNKNEKPEENVSNEVTNDVEETIKKTEPGVKESNKSKEEEHEELLEDIKKDLKIELTEDDLYNILVNPHKKKENIEIFPGRMYASFKFGLTTNELLDVDRKMTMAQEYKHLEAGFKTLNTQHILSHALLELGKTDNLKPIGDTPEERFEEIGKMSSLLVEMLSKKWNMFLFLISDLAKKESSLKK